MVASWICASARKQVSHRADREKRRRVVPDIRVALCRSVAADVGRLVAQIGTAAQSKQEPDEFQRRCNLGWVTDDGATWLAGAGLSKLRVRATTGVLKLPLQAAVSPVSLPHRAYEKGRSVEPPSSGKKAPSNAPDPNGEVLTPRPESTQRPADALRVLVVDDDPGVRDVTVRLLEFEGVRATSVASGQEALALLDSESFDCVVLDLTMPRLSGKDTFRALRKSNLELPVVFSSGQRDDSVDSLVVAGSNAYFLDKPFSPRRLLDVIVLACKR